MNFPPFGLLPGILPFLITIVGLWLVVHSIINSKLFRVLIIIILFHIPKLWAQFFIDLNSPGSNTPEPIEELNLKPARDLLEEVKKKKF